MPPQDDEREREMVRLFNLTVPEGRGRADVDAVLRLEGREVPFELKSTTGSSISTVRDFGPDHVRKWRDLHWLFGFYDSAGRLLHCHYASPELMAPWVEGRSSYVRPDFVLADRAPELVTEAMVVELFGERDVYPPHEARSIQKKQYSAEMYRQLMDRENGYSRQRMVEILQDRCRYLIQRGATLNNPKIARAYFDGWERITEDHAIRLRQLVRDYLEGPVPTPMEGDA